MNISYRSEGSGEPIVFLHAFPLNRSMWEGQVAEFSATHRVMTFDWPGFGESPLDEGEPGMDRFADCLVGLLDHLGLDRVHLCGLSMGGYAALAFYRRWPERIASLILCDTRATADTEEARKGRYETAALARREGAAPLVESMTPRLLGATSLAERPDLVGRVKEMILSSHPEGIARALIGMAERPDSTDLLAGIEIPTLIVAGNEDKLTPPEEMRTMADAIPGATFLIIDRAGHLPNLEQPSLFNQALREFLPSR